MSKIEEAAAVIRQLQAALSLHVSMVASGEMATNRSTSIKLDAQLRANQWLDSIELPKQVREWPQYMQRAWIEKQELDVKATKLSEFIAHSHVFEELPFEEQHLLREQCEAMWQYSHFLGRRLDRFASQKQASQVVSCSDGVLTLPEFESVEGLIRGNELKAESVEYPIANVVVAPQGEGHKLADTIQSAYERQQKQAQDESRERLDRFKKAAQPLIDYLREFGNPHIKAIIEPDYAEVVEGKMGFNANPKWQKAGLRPGRAT